MASGGKKWCRKLQVGMEIWSNEISCKTSQLVHYNYVHTCTCIHVDVCSWGIWYIVDLLHVIVVPILHIIQLESVHFLELYM